jgi:UDP-hydrolysing UDP-N-acetyl-D-glucosamine 2-epimerase
MVKILALTGIRSDYDLMSPLYRLLANDPETEFKVLVGGAHLSSYLGCSIAQIENDGFSILGRIESLLASDSTRSRVKSAAILLQGCVDMVADYKPDLILYAGDREEVIVGALLGGYLEIPTVHFYGGDHTQDGYIDNAVRHAASKLSTAHFVTLDEHRKRLVAIGESPDRIFVVGNISLDNFYNFIPWPVAEIKQQLNLPDDFDAFALVIFHPISEERQFAAQIFDTILTELRNRNTHAFVGYPNADPGNYRLRETIAKHDDGFFYFYKNLDRQLFLSIYKQARFIIGNSSSGILEAASIPIPAVNVGQRQLGRRAAENVVFCGTDAAAIGTALAQVDRREFYASLCNMQNPYGDGKSAARAYELIKSTDFAAMLFKREDALEIGKSL